MTEYKNTIKNKTKILDQYLKEKLSAMRVRQVKINNWIRDEELYNGVTQKTLITRSNLHVPKVFEGVQTMSSRIGLPPEPDYSTIPEGDENASEIMKHITLEDLDFSDWELTYQNSKVEAGIYGRTIYKLIPSNDGNRVELVDTLSFLISPIAKNCKDALYLGQQFIYKTLPELLEEAEEMEYDTEELEKIKTQKVPSESQRDTSSESSVKNIRLANLGLANVTQYGSKVVEITEWYTYISNEDGTKRDPYILTVADDSFLLRCVKLKDAGLPRFPFVSWGVFPRGITFWCPSLADVLRDPNLAMNVIVNQMIDNNTYRNFGMMFVSSASGLKQSSIQPRPLGVTPVNIPAGGNIKDHVWQFTPPEISTASQTMSTINGIAESAAGLSVHSPGQRGKQSVTQVSAQNSQIEMKTSLIRQNAVNACKELFQLMADTIKMNLTKPRRVKIFGYKELTLEGVTRKNFEDVDLIAKATPQESSQENKAIKQKARMSFYELFKDDPKLPGQLALRRAVAKEFDFSPNEVESFFTAEEKQPAQALPQGQPQQQEGQATQPPENPNQPLLAQTQQAAQAQVPPAIK